MRRISLCLVAALVFVMGVRPLAVSTLMGIEPGASTRADAERVFGPAVKALSPSAFEYAPQNGSGPIVIEYRAGSSIVERIELQLASPVEPAAIAHQLALSDAPTSSRTRQQQFVEYYGAAKTLVITHQTTAPDSPVSSIGYYSRELFDRETADLQKSGAATEPPPPAVRLSNPADAPVIKEFNPAACSDLFYWARSEQEPARKSKSATRRQAIIEVMITAQKGDCVKARVLADEYRQRFMGGR